MAYIQDHTLQQLGKIVTGDVLWTYTWVIRNSSHPTSYISLCRADITPQFRAGTDYRLIDNRNQFLLNKR